MRLLPPQYSVFTFTMCTVGGHLPPGILGLRASGFLIVGSTVGMSCANRHGNWETAIEEAVVAWNSPQPYHPAAIPFINHSLNHLFKGEGKWHDKFTHQDNTHIERRVGSGVVMARHKKDPQRLPDSFYDTSAL